MKAKEYLRQLKEIDKLMLTVSEELACANASLTPSGISLEEVSAGTGGTSGPTEKKAMHLAELREELEQARIDYVRIKVNAIRLLRKMNTGKHQEILYLYYLQNKTLSKVAEETNRSYQNVCEIRNQALEKFQKLMDEEGVS